MEIEQPAEAPDRRLENLTLDQARNLLRQLAADVGEWAGLPLALKGTNMVVEPSHPLAEVFNKKEEEPEEDLHVRNSFYSMRRTGTIYVFDDPKRPGKVDWALHQRANHHLRHDIQGLGVADAWSMDQECNALRLLESLVRPRTFKQYLLTGMFLESSKRSGVTYLFRKLKPTVALSGRTGDMRILCALCLHPIAFYEGSWAGAMCPTDDVIAHLMLMRADEKMFWRRANHHPAWTPEAGL